jgi:hypothetical protein
MYSSHCSWLGKVDLAVTVDKVRIRNIAYPLVGREANATRTAEAIGHDPHISSLGIFTLVARLANAPF